MNEALQAAIRYALLNRNDFEPRFAQWLSDHWSIYAEFERLALYGASRGRDRVSAKFLFEQIRWNTALSEDGGWKLNNSMAASCARLFAHRQPKHADLFEFRAKAVQA